MKSSKRRFFTQSDKTQMWDRWKLVLVTLFKICWTDITKITVPALSVVEAFDVIK